MQAKLPDINSALVRHRGGALVAVHQDNYAIAATELSAMNALLPVDYKVKIDDKIYYEKIRAQDVMVCNKCGGETEHASLAFYPRALSAELQLLYGVIMVDMWECSKCHHENPRDGTKRTIRKYEHPFYTGYMPNPPKMDSFGNRATYRISFAKWFDIAINELESKIGEYRADYSAQEEDGGSTITDEDDNG